MLNAMNEELEIFIPSFADPPLWIELAGISYGHPDYAIQRDNSYVSVLEFVLGGAGYVKINETVHKVTENMIYYLPMGQPHHYWSDKKEPYSKIFMNIYGLHLNRLLSAYKLSDKYFFHSPSLRSSFLKIPEIIHQPLSELEMQATLQGVALEIFARLLFKAEKISNNHEALAMRDLIHKNTHRILSNEELAQHIFRSTNYSINLFRREFGCTPYQYQLDKKISMAKSMLSCSTLSVGDIAAQLGYEDQHYFFNLFYNRMGIRPLAFRRAGEKKTDD